MLVPSPSAGTEATRWSRGEAPAQILSQLLLPSVEAGGEERVVFLVTNASRQRLLSSLSVISPCLVSHRLNEQMKTEAPLQGRSGLLATTALP